MQVCGNDSIHHKNYWYGWRVIIAGVEVKNRHNTVEDVIEVGTVLSAQCE
ncbi:hypothetical protein CRENPOLYSF1_350036 [Crenothrix polyspora]|uniref:Uncharacterized protein n=1 Tax=Crenothrix polyspora TaxID=360316 RepID=A0A1R4H9K4_9GAMM|nr:hypothetical protein CRENPOLYSF1_350036 [Crenothrix polyspora]